MAQNKAQTIYLSSKADFITLITTGTLTKNGITITYDPNVQYCIPEEETAFEVIEAPASTTLTDDEYATLTNGKSHQIVGTFLGYKNPILFASNLRSPEDIGILFGLDTISSVCNAVVYSINSSTKVISIPTSRYLAIKNLWQVNGKIIPNYPVGNDKFDLIYSNGAIDWELRKRCHNINVQHTTAQGTYNYQFQILSLQTTQFSQLGDIGHYLFTNYPNMKIPATGTYTESGVVYMVVSIKASSVDNMVDVEMYKLSDGTARTIQTGVISVDDTILN